MHIAARANALHNLLPHVATLVEVERSHLLGLLGQVALANVDAIDRNTCRDAMHLQRLAAYRSCPGCQQRAPGLINILGREPDLVGFMVLILAAHHRARDASTVAVAT